MPGNLQHRAIGLHRTAACLHPLIERQGIADAFAKAAQIVGGIDRAGVAEELESGLPYRRVDGLAGGPGKPGKKCDTLSPDVFAEDIVHVEEDKLDPVRHSSTLGLAET